MRFLIKYRSLIFPISIFLYCLIIISIIYLNIISSKERVIITINSLFIVSHLFIGLFVLLNWRKTPFADELINLGDYSLSVRDIGKGEPTVIIEQGLNCRKNDNYLLAFLTAFKCRVINYDHAGIGKSTESSNPRTLPYYVEELRALLKYKNIPPPYILIGHSLGGYIIRYYAHLFPNEVAGLILLDSPHEDWFRYVRSSWSRDEQKEYFRIWNNPPVDTARNEAYRLERLAFEANMDLLRGKVIPPNIPVLMFTSSCESMYRKDQIGIEQDTKVWAEMQKLLIENHDNAKHVIDMKAIHHIHLNKPLFVQKEINKFINKSMKIWRENSSLD